MTFNGKPKLTKREQAIKACLLWEQLNRIEDATASQSEVDIAKLEEASEILGLVLDILGG